MKFYIACAIICIVLCILQQNVQCREIQGRIVSGTQAAVEQFPWQVIIKESGKLKCGGSIVSEQWVLTAGHCTYGVQSLDLFFGTILLNDDTAVTMTSADFIIHPDYNDATLDNDISVVLLPKPLTFSKTIQPIALVSSTANSLEGTVATIAGFGLQSDEYLVFSKDLLWAQVEIVDNNICEALFTKEFFRDTNMCARGYRDITQSICSGDSGGPLIARDAQNNWIQIGINSFVAFEACTEGYPSAYVRLSSYLSYIGRTTGITM